VHSCSLERFQREDYFTHKQQDISEAIIHIIRNSLGSESTKETIMISKNLIILTLFFSFAIIAKADVCEDDDSWVQVTKKEKEITCDELSEMDPKKKKNLCKKALGTDDTPALEACAKACENCKDGEEDSDEDEDDNDEECEDSEDWTSAKGDEMCSDIADMEKNKLEVRYELVENVKDVHIRFAAYYRKGGNTHTQDEWKKLSILHWAQLMSSSSVRSPQLANELTQVIVKACPSYDAFFFETKGTSYNNTWKQFEFILVNSHSFTGAEANPDPNAFKEYMNCGESMVCSFWNLGGTARLIAPRQQNGEDLKKYSHLAIFLRGALKEEMVQMWGRVTDEYLNILKERGGKPVWLSTSGLGISWLHFRLDQRPKYYTFREFALEK